MLLICPFSDLFQLIWIQFYYPNPSIFCMMNRFYLLVIISFWNKYTNRKWVQKAIFVTLGNILHTICLLLLTSKQISHPFSLWWLCFLFSFLHHPGLPGAILASVFYFPCFFFCMPQAVRYHICITATSVSASLGAAYISSLAAQPQLYFFHQAKCSCVGIVYTSLCPLSPPHPSRRLHCQLCVTAPLSIPVRRSGGGRGDWQCLPLAA